MEQMCVPANGVNPLKVHLVLCHTSFSLASSIVRAIYYDDEDVEKDTSLPGQFSVHDLVVWMHEAASLYSRQVCKIGNHVNEDVDALEEDGLVDKLVVVVQEDGGAVEG